MVALSAVEVSVVGLLVLGEWVVPLLEVGLLVLGALVVEMLEVGSLVLGFTVVKVPVPGLSLVGLFRRRLLASESGQNNKETKHYFVVSH